MQSSSVSTPLSPFPPFDPTVHPYTPSNISPLSGMAGPSTAQFNFKFNPRAPPFLRGAVSHPPVPISSRPSSAPGMNYVYKQQGFGAAGPVLPPLPLYQQEAFAAYAAHYLPGGNLPYPGTYPHAHTHHGGANWGGYGGGYGYGGGFGVHNFNGGGGTAYAPRFANPNYHNPNPNYLGNAYDPQHKGKNWRKNQRSRKKGKGKVVNGGGFGWW